MRSATGPQWIIRHEVSENVQFVVWLRRRMGAVGGIRDTQWMDWMDGVTGVSGAPSPESVAATAPNDHVRAECLASWCRFAGEWETERRALEKRIGTLARDFAVQSRVRAIMGSSNDQVVLIQTDEPGSMCRRAGQGWLLGEAYLAPDAFCTLLEQLRNDCPAAGSTCCGV